jgi:hypothetical protein
MGGGHHFAQGASLAIVESRAIVRRAGANLGFTMPDGTTNVASVRVSSDELVLDFATGRVSYARVLDWPQSRGVDLFAVEREVHLVGCVGDGEDHVRDTRLEQRELSGCGVACGVVFRVALRLRGGVANRGEHAVVGLGGTAELA